ncbi:hypothetical protein PHIN3_381 [Sinorhizobium phage phiN3]|uniref:Uncharacterized protein n=1 Tax=Sinorhizobium phage phiN3 TaxID=1647405 RepID=A0A0F6YQ97_9CAUD|nr:hypothetical protein AVT40_gp152 [Sinorhizobium phage phiN3]AKF13644.1 hypothetical protein PHIN3_381 [Sinorhizobium phage phiN3]
MTDVKKLTKTIVINVEAVSVAIPGTDEFVLVYWRNVGQDEIYTHVMKADEYKKVKSPDDIKHYEFIMPHHQKSKDKYKANFLPMSRSQIDSIREGKHDWYDDKYPPPNLEFGQELPDDVEVIGYCYADYTFCDINGKYINRMIRDSYLDRYYRIRDIVQNEKDNPDVLIIPERDYYSDRDPIYYVPGNGDTLNLGLRLTDEQYEEYLKVGWYERTQYLGEKTIIGKYKREERHDAFDDYDD